MTKTTTATTFTTAAAAAEEVFQVLGHVFVPCMLGALITTLPHVALVWKMTLALILVALHMNWPMLVDMWRYRHIPGPTPLPFIGNILDFTSQGMHTLYQSLEEKHGGAFKLFLGTSTLIVLPDVEAVREVGLRKFSVFTNRPMPPEKLTNVLPTVQREAQGFGILQAKDAYWKGIRATSHHIFHSTETMAGFCPLMKETADELARRLSDLQEGEVVDIWRALGDMTLDVVGTTVFGVRFNSVQNHGADAVKASRLIFKNANVFNNNNPYFTLALVAPGFMGPAIKAAAEAFPTERMKESAWANKVLRKISDDMYDLARKDIEKKEVEEEKEGHAKAAEAPAGNGNAEGESEYDYSGNSFLKLFLKGHNRATGKILTKPEVTAQAFIFLLAGYETTANTLAYTIYMLAKHKDKEQLLLDEIDKLMRGGDVLPSAEELKEYKYLDAVLKEVLRYTGPATVIARAASKDVEIQGNRLFKGTAVHLPIYSLHLNAEYFPSPEAFMPERFLESSAVFGEQNHKAFMPFGLGPRMCVAWSFALTEAKLALITLYSKFRFEHNPGHTFERTMGVTLSPTYGIEVIPIKRSVSGC